MVSNQKTIVNISGMALSELKVKTQEKKNDKDAAQRPGTVYVLTI